MTTLPNFNIDITTIEATVTAHIAACRTAIQNALTAPTPTWENLVTATETIDDQLSQYFAPIRHLHAVCNTEPLRAIYERCLIKLSEYQSEVGQNQQLYQAYQRLADSNAFGSLSPAQQKIIQNALRDFRLSGVDLPPEKKQRFAAIQQQLTQLASQFENHILDATDHWHYHTTDLTELTGLPESTLQAGREKAQQQNKPGYLLGIDFPTYYAVLTYADNRTLREQFYQAYQTRASDQGPDAGKWDNSQFMMDILALRQEEAQLLGFKHYAEFSLATKMAKSPQEVLQFLMDLAVRSRPFAERDLTELKQYAAAQGLKEALQSWDLSYYSEKLCQERYHISQEALRAYFPAERVLSGLFELTHILFGLQFRSIAANTWHPDVRVYEIVDEQQHTRGVLYVDLYARAQKRGGAWMDDCRTRCRLTNGDIQLPIAFLTCNFAPPTSQTPALLTHDDVQTLFHELGHCLQHLLTQVDYLGVSGIHGVAWDAVELPSQFMENFCWQKAVINMISAHYQTGESLPEQQLQQLKKTQHYQAGMQMIRQMELSLFDFRLHMEYPVNIQGLLDQVRQEVSLLIPPRYVRFQHAFSHIFAGGYAAGYYSYKWAEVLSADAFSRFEEEGVLNPKTGRDFMRCILETGGSQDAMDLFVAFRGRTPTIDALLRQLE